MAVDVPVGASTDGTRRVESQRMRAEILTIGDELCRGEIVDTNSSCLAARLWDLDIADALDDQLPRRRRRHRRPRSGRRSARADVVVVLRRPRADRGRSDRRRASPSCRDRRRSSTSRRARMERSRNQRFASPSSRRRSTPNHLRQVRVPAARACTQLRRARAGVRGRARGVPGRSPAGRPARDAGDLRRGPGVPSPRLREAAGERRADRAPDLSRVRAGRVAHRPGVPRDRRRRRRRVDPLPGEFPETLVKLVVRDRDEARPTRGSRRSTPSCASGSAACSTATATRTLVDASCARLTRRRRTIATAESCTGGMIGELLTDVPGSSASFTGGAIAYANDEKIAPARRHAGDARRARRGQRGRRCARWPRARARGSASTLAVRDHRRSPGPTAARPRSRSARSGSRSPQRRAVDQKS